MSTVPTYDRPARSPLHANGRQLRSGDPHDVDPFGEIPGIAPNLGQDVLPHVVTFQGLLRNVARSYSVSDEAIRHSWDNARFMRNDPGIMECLEQRQRSTALLGWHLEAEDEKDPLQKYLVEELTAILKQTKNFLKYRENLLHALWYGKYGVSHRYRWKKVGRQMRVVVDRWRPVNGDKLVFRYDDGSGEFDDDQVGIRVGAGFTAGSSVANRWKVERFGKIAATDHGLAYFLEHWERPLLAIHKHMIEDAEYEAPERAGALHGVGIRSRLYWMWFQKQETLAWLMEYLERSAFGIEIWSYPAGNPQAEEKTRQAATERIGNNRNVVLVPRHPDSDILSSDIKRIEPGMAGADVLDRIIREYFGWQIKRYILGQILTSETASTGLGSGVATIHLDTYLQIVRYDAINLAETITTDLVQPLLRYNWPRYADVPIRFVIETESPDVDGKLRAWKDAYEMGLKLRATDVAELIGAAVAQPGEETLQNPQASQQGQLAAGQAQQANGPQENMRKLIAALGARAGGQQYRRLRPGMERLVYDRQGNLRRVERYGADFDEKHPRGQPGNAGQWAKKGDEDHGSESADVPANQGEVSRRESKSELPTGSKEADAEPTAATQEIVAVRSSRLLSKPPVPITVVEPQFHGNFQAARVWAMANLRKSDGYENDDQGIRIRIGRRAIEKATHEKAYQKSDIPEHLEALHALPLLLKHAILGEQRPDAKGDPHIKAVDRFFVPLVVGNALYRVKLTVKEYENQDRQAGYYTHELAEIELPASLQDEGGSEKPPSPRPAGSNLSIRDLLAGVKADDGTPLIVEDAGREKYRAVVAPKHKPGWRTVGGGARAYIGADGKVKKGCPGLKGEDVDDLGEEEEPENRRRREHRQDVAEHHGIEGEDLSRGQVEQLEAHPHPETGRDADGRQRAKPAIHAVEFAGRQYEVKHDGSGWFFRLNSAAGWTQASPATAKAIESQLDDIPFDVPDVEQEEHEESPSAGQSQNADGDDGDDDQRARINPRTRVGKAILETASDWGVPPDNLADALEYVWQQRVAAAAGERQQALAAARKLTGLYPSDVKRLKNAGYDQTSAGRVGGKLGQRLAHFDEFAQEIAREHPILGLGNPDDSGADFAAALWAVLDEDRGKAPAMDDPDLLAEAAKMALAHAQQKPGELVGAGDSYEEFRRRGEVIRYRKWLAEKYGKSAKGQMSFEWKEDEHPRDASGEFAKKGEAESHGSHGPDVSADKEETAATAEEAATYRDYVTMIEASKLKPRSMDEWLGNYRSAQERLKGGREPEPSQPAAASHSKEPPAPDNTLDVTPETTPREAADKLFDSQVAGDYAYARASAVPNAGEDVLGSARHVRNAWRGLDEAERDGTAVELVARDKLLKNEPHKLMVYASRNPLTTLAMHYAIRAFPAAPGYGSRKPTAEQAQKNRREYLDAYRRIKDKAEDLAAGEDDPVKASKDLGAFVWSLAKEYRGQEGDSYTAQIAARDRYNATANGLISLTNRLNSNRKKTSIQRQTAEFARSFQEKYGETLSPDERLERLGDHVGDILEGASVNKTLGRETESRRGFNPADLYVKIAARKGGPQVPAGSAKQAAEYLLGTQQFRGLQFGNSVSDEEREHHVRKSAEAFADLADVLGIPAEYVSFKGKLAVAFGARGRANAVAHYEPAQQIINLTRKNGVGSLAHEWGHFFDHQLAGGEILENTRRGAEPMYFSNRGTETREYRDGRSTKVDHTEDPLWQAFGKVKKAWESSGFQKRMNQTLVEMIHNGQISDGKRSYWRSNTEMFARTFERYVQKKLEDAGRKNTYLAGIETKAHKEGGLWPTDAEVEAMTPAFDAIFREFRGGIKKGRYWLRETGERIVLERTPALVEQFNQAFRARGFSP